MEIKINEKVLAQALTAAIALGGAAFAVSKLLKGKADSEEVSTTSSGHSGAVYETHKAVSEYLMFHFGADDDILPYPNGPREALNFASRTAALCVDWARKLDLPLDAAFDVGCAVGRTSFDLSRDFSRVVGLDFSHAFIAAANELKRTGSAPYTMYVEGDVHRSLTATVPQGSKTERITFRQGDACALPSEAELGGKFSVIHGANLLCRLPEPRDFLNRLPSLLVPGGLVVFISPYSWLKQYTAKERWLGGTVDASSGAACMSSEGLSKHMTGLGFTLVHQENCPFLIREHARKFQWGCSHVTIWQLKK